MKKHIIILLITTLFAGMTLPAQERPDSLIAFIADIKQDDFYLWSETRDESEDVANEEALTDLKKKVKKYVSENGFPIKELDDVSDLVDEKLKRLSLMSGNRYRIFMYFHKEELFSILPPGNWTLHISSETIKTKRSVTIESNRESSRNAPSQPMADPKPVESVPPQEESKPVEVVTPKEELKPVEVVTPKEEPKPVEIVTPQEEPKPVEVVPPKVEPEPEEAPQPKVEHTQVPTNNTQLVEVMPDVPESAVKLSSSPEFKYTEDDTTGIAEFMRAVINCRTLNQVYDLVTNYKKDGANIDYKKPATSKDTDYYLVLYQRTSGKLEAILSPSARGGVVNIITGDPDGLQNHPGTSFAGFKTNVE